MQELDIAFVNGWVFDGTGSLPLRQDVGVRDGIIVSLDSAEIADLTTPGTRVVDLTGKMLMPGFIDAHIHPIEAGVERLGCDLSSGYDRETYLDMIRAYVAGHPEKEWIIGGGWQQAAFPGGTPVASDLDEICDDRPMIISNRDHHSAWVNSKMLSLAGIDRNTPDPTDGRIERDEDGNPTGTLHEGARMLALGIAPQSTNDDMYEGLMEAQRYLHSFGITGWQDAIIGDYGNHSSDIVHIYQTALDNDTLRARVNGAIWWKRAEDDRQLAGILELNKRYQHELFKATSVKIMQDGVTENKTAAMTEPYVSSGCSCGNHETGISFVDPEKLKEYVVELDRLGMQVHFHAIGDRAVRESLDAVEAARRANPNSEMTHHIAHLQVVHPDDVPRFAKLNVAANMQALWASNDPQMVELNIPILGENRVDWQYPFESIRAAGAHLCAGSDWPVTTPDPWLGMHVAVNRQHPINHPDHNPEVFVPGERITLGDALKAYTSESAHINGRGNYTGAIKVGYAADLAVVERNPFDYPTDQIYSTKTIETFFAGESVFQREHASGIHG